MKKIKLLKALGLASLAISMSACSLLGGNNNNTGSTNNTTTNSTVAVTSVSLDIKEITLELGQSANLVATVAPDNATDKTIVWSASNANVTVAGGEVTAVKVGTSTVTAKSGGKSDKCTVKVVDTPVINNEKFTVEKLYIFAGMFKFLDSPETQYDIRYSFKTDGTMFVKDAVKNEESTGTYKVKDKMIYTYNAAGEESDTFFYYDNVIMLASLVPVTLARDGSAVSQKGTGTLGYYAVIQCHVGDSLGVLTGKADSAGYYVTLRNNGTFATSRSYVNSDQIVSTDFDTTSAGTKIIKITITYT